MLSTNKTLLAYGFSAGFLSAIAFVSIFFPYSRNGQFISFQSYYSKLVVVIKEAILSS